MAPEDADLLTDDPSDGLQEAHSFFLRTLQGWVAQHEQDGADVSGKFRLLTAVIRELLKLVITKSGA